MNPLLAMHSDAQSERDELHQHLAEGLAIAKSQRRIMLHRLRKASWMTDPITRKHAALELLTLRARIVLYRHRLAKMEAGQ